MKKLYRSQDRMLSGVLGGVSEYLNIDPVVIRLVFIVFLICTGVFPGLIIYLIAAMMIPDAPRITPSKALEDDPIEV